MKNNAKTGSAPSKTHYGGAPKNPPVIKQTAEAKSKDPKKISKGAQESNLNIKPKK